MFYETVWSYGEHQLVKRPDTTNYHIYWKPRKGAKPQRKSTGTSDLETAKRRLIEFARPRLRPSLVPEDELELLDLLADHVEPIIARARPKPCTEITTLKHWARFMELFDVRSVADLTTGMQERFVEWRYGEIRAAGHRGSPATVGRELRTMRAALNSAWKRGLLAMPKHVISLPTTPPRPRFLFADEANRLLLACEQTPHLRLFVLIALHTLQRPGAIFGLRTEQVDIRGGLIDFLPAEQIQTHKRKPIVPISDTLRPMLEDAVEESITGFVIEHEGRPVNSVRNAFAKACKRAGLDGVTPYTLRHTGATLLLASGVPIWEVSGMLGHSVQRTTELYGKHHPAFLKEALAGVDRLFTGRIDAA